MVHAKTLLAGGAVFLTGYCVGSCHYTQSVSGKTLEQKVLVDIPASPTARQQLFTFLRQYQGTSPEKEKKAGSDYFKNIWDALPQETKTKIIKHVVGSQLEHYYGEVKEESSGMYGEIKQYLEKQFGGKQ